MRRAAKQMLSLADWFHVRPSPVTPSLYAGYGWQPPGGQGVYGGHLIAQAINAAFQQVGPSSPHPALLHSCHSYFHSAVAPYPAPILYHVNDLKIGRRLRQCHVDVIQGNRTVFTSILSFALDQQQNSRLAYRNQVSVPRPGYPKQILAVKSGLHIIHVPWIARSYVLQCTCTNSPKKSRRRRARSG